MTANSVHDNIDEQKGKCIIKCSNMPKFLCKSSTTRDDLKKSVPICKKEETNDNAKYLPNRKAKNVKTSARTRNMANANTVQYLAYSSFL